MKAYRTCQRKGALSISFPATLEHVDRVCEKVKLVSTESGFGHASFAIQLLLRELLDNAVLHGNKADPEKRVKCKMSWNGSDAVKIAVEDEGDGFDWRKRMGKKVSCRSGSGRGIAIMKQYGKEIRFNRKGNKVAITIDVSQGGACGKDNKGC